jgi:predicted permease
VWPRLLERVRAIPGVRSVGLTGAVPFSGNDGSGTYRLTDRPVGPSELPPHAFLHTVGGDYFTTMEIPLIAGRLFNDTDTATAPRVVVIDEFLAKRQFAGQDPIGRQINFGSPRNYTIIGVVGNINLGDLGTPVAEERIYFTNTQVTQSIMGVVIKTAVDAASIAPQLRAAIRDVDPVQGVSEVRTLDEWLSRSLQPRRTPATLLAMFGLVSAVLAAIGIYGVLAFGVAERTREFGIRQALGADGASILTLVLKQGLGTAVAGIVIGLAASFALARYLESLLYGVRPHDLPVFAGVAALLFVVAAAACYVPARRATRVEPMTALRDA